MISSIRSGSSAANAKDSSHQGSSLKRAVSHQKLVESQMKQYIEQKMPNYQHLDANCACPTCLCGKHKCIVKCTKLLLIQRKAKNISKRYVINLQR